MRLRKNPEVAKLFALLILVFLLALLLALLLSQAGMQAYKQALLTNQAAIVGAISTEYPEMDSRIISQLVSPSEAETAHGQAILAQYGINLDTLLPHTEALRSSSWWNTAYFFILVLCLFLMLVFLFYLFLKSQYSSIRKVNEYARQIAEGNYALDIRDNDEGELSLLKNEIYKITTMLREQMNKLQKDKIGLADSIADISHQLKTPMTSLFVLNDLLESQPDEKDQREFLQRMRSQLNRMEWLVTALLKLSKLDAGTVVMKREPYQVKALINKALETLAIPLEIKMHDVSITGEDHIQLNGDWDWTLEAFVNLLKNAIEHTPEHGCIQIAFEENPLFVKVTLTDNGAGIAAEDLPYLFNRFYKGQNAGDDSVGIGLAMAYAIVTKQGGDIAVQSELGNGTTFVLTFFKNVNNSRY